jgi:hypothetical protein
LNPVERKTHFRISQFAIHLSEPTPSQEALSDDMPKDKTDSKQMFVFPFVTMLFKYTAMSYNGSGTLVGPVLAIWASFNTVLM